MHQIQMLQKAFYPLAASLNPNLTIPYYALPYISASYNPQVIQEAMQQDAEYNIAKDDSDDNDDLYDEWDRPSIEDVKLMQLSKRPSN
jgi:hypothetical protein